MKKGRVSINKSGIITASAINEVYAALKARIQRAAVGEEQKKALIARLRQRFESARVAAPYFPLARFGDFWVRAKDGPEAGFYMFESSRPQQRFAKPQQAQGHEVTSRQAPGEHQSGAGRQRGIRGL